MIGACELTRRQGAGGEREKRKAGKNIKKCLIVKSECLSSSNMFEKQIEESHRWWEVVAAADVRLVLVMLIAFFDGAQPHVLVAHCAVHRPHRYGARFVHAPRAQPTHHRLVAAGLTSAFGHL